ncbi:hypothetical protein RB195_009520 [Necator americanus]
MASKRWQRFIAASLLTAALFYLTINRQILRRLQNEEDIKESTLFNLFSKTYGRERIIEHSVCLMDGTCVDIRERLVHDGRKYLVAREITAGMLRTSTMFLKTPKKLTASIMDTTKWEVDSGAITFESYVTTMIEEIFISGAAQMSPYNSAHILMLGLGGGYINSYLHHKFPNMDITVVELDPQMLEISKKWFGLKLDQRQRVFLMDGVHFVRNAVTEGRKYDAILVDACTSDTNAWIICPANDFVVPEVVKKFAELLTDKGSLIVNVLSIRHKKVIGTMVQNIFNQAFKYCILKQAHSRSNLVITCAQHPLPKGLESKYEKFAGYGKYGAKVSRMIGISS